MTRTFGLVGVLLLVVVAALIRPGTGSGAGAAVMALGFVLTVSFVLGRSVTYLGLPAVTGYILVGLAFGPYLLGALHPALAVLGRDAVSTLRLLDSVALGLIALTAGGELKLPTLRGHAPVIAGVIGSQVVLGLIGMLGAVWLARGLFPELAALPGNALLAAGLLFATTALANSPAVALAIVQEYEAKGPMTEVVLAVTVAKDVVVIVLFTVAISLAGALTGEGGVGGGALLVAGWEVLGSVGMGLLLGWLAVQYLQRVGAEVPLLVLAVAFAAVAMLPGLHLSGVLACLVAGFYIENFSPHGDELIQAIERHELPVYVVFFTIAGAGLDVEALRATWPLALFLAGTRLALTAAGTALGGRLGGAPPALLRYGWSGFVAQAGVTLGFAALIAEQFPQFGGFVKTVVLAVVALNQVAGPILFRIGLSRAGEIPERGE